MKKLLLPLTVLAVLTIPASASAAEHCRNARGQFAKCGTPGAVPDSQYVSKAEKAAGVKPKVVAPKAAPAVAAPAVAPVKAGGPCKDAKGKFIKCGAAPVAAPAAPAPKAVPAAVPAVPAAAPKKGPCKDAKGKFIKCAA